MIALLHYIAISFMKVHYAMLGRKLMKENPQTGQLYQMEINQHKLQCLHDTELIDAIFIHFCFLENIKIEDIRYSEGRNTFKTISHRRKFIAVVVQMYDTLNMNGFTGRKTDRLRAKISDVLNCHEIWISQVWDSIHNELQHWPDFKQETQQLIEQIKSLLSQNTFQETKFVNVRRSAQLGLF